MPEPDRLTRPELLEKLNRHFGIKQRLGDDLIRQQLTKDEDERAYVTESMKGHARVFEIDWDAASEAPWYPQIQPVAKMA